MKFSSIAAAAACAVFPASTLAAPCSVGLIADLKVTMQGASPLVRAKINGEEVSLIADSGAYFSTLSEGTVAQLKLPIVATNPFAFSEGIGGRQSLSVTKVKAFTVADQTLPNIPFTMSDNELAPGVAGLMGQNVLGYADAYYDLSNGSIKLTRPKGCGDHPFVLWETSRAFSTIALDGAAGPFKRTAGEAFVNGKRIRVLFDTGASTSLLSLDAARRAGVETVGVDVTSAGVERGIGRRMIQSWVVPVASFKIGDEEVRNTRLRIAAMSLQDIDMLLGADFFLSHRVYVANSQHRIYFTYNGGPVFNLASPLVADTGPAAATESTPEKPADKPAAKPPTAAQDAWAEPSDADGFSRRGTAFAGRRQFVPAIADLTRATAMAPSEAKYFTQRAVVYLENRQPLLAMADLDKALKLKPDDVPALVTRAELRVSGRAMTGALADLAEADRILPKEADIRLTMAGLYDSADAAAAAIGQYNLWIKAHPDDNRLPQALNGRCWARALWNIDVDKAVADCDAAIRRAGKVAAFYDSRGLAHLRLGENDRAIADYDAALAMEPKIAWSLYGRGVARLRAGLTAEGKGDITAATALDPAVVAVARDRGLDR